MTRVAILADIHGNIPALEAVVTDIASQGVDEVLVGGDLVGRGPQGSEVIRRVRQLGWPSVRGNHEDYLLTFHCGQVPPDWLEAEEWSASRWMADELADSDVPYLQSLPFSVRSQQLPHLHLVHASPHSNNDGIGPWTSVRHMQRHLDAIEESVLVCAHTHRPLHQRFADGQVVNVGSVGLPFNGDQRAQYAILEEIAGETEIEFRQVEYDLESILRIYESSGFLAEGGVTARLLMLELEKAQPFLVPFLHWASTLGVPAAAEQIERFREYYDPDEPIKKFLCRLAELAGRDTIEWGSDGR